MLHVQKGLFATSGRWGMLHATGPVYVAGGECMHASSGKEGASCVGVQGPGEDKAGSAVGGSCYSPHSD